MEERAYHQAVSNRYLDWFRQAEADLAAARDSLAAGHFEWACFTAQQAAEKAVKALFLRRGMDAWGHTITPLMGNLPEEARPGEEIINCAKVLDKHYIPTRYPNDHRLLFAFGGLIQPPSAVPCSLTPNGCARTTPKCSPCAGSGPG